MEELLFAENLLLRMPANSWNTYDDNSQKHLDNLYFRAAIYIASPLFFSCLEQKGFIYKDLSEKEKLTCKKYINRCCFRPTPFGLFAGVSLIRWDARTQLALQTIKGNDVIIVPDQAFVLKMSQELLNEELQTRALYEPNPTLYRLSDEFRFISSEIDDQDQSRRYLLQSIEYTVVLKDLAAYCAVPKTIEEVITRICELANCTVAIGGDYLSFLAEEQFLVQRYRPNINGPEYIELLLNNIARNSKHSIRSLAVQRLMAELHTPSVVNNHDFQQLNSKFKSLLFSGLKDKEQNQFNVLLNRKLETGSLSNDWQSKIRDALFALNCLSPNETIPGMEKFVAAFQKDFEGQSLDLLYALDPEVGIGYYIAETEKENQLTETLQISPKSRNEDAGNWTPIHSFLLEQWHKASALQVPVIVLTEEDLMAIKPQNSNNVLFGLSVLFRVLGDQVYIESAGGVNAPAMMGRFTTGDEEIAAAARKIARQQEADNPEIMFAEILHLAGPHTDNVNRREVIWSYDLPLTAISTLPMERQLALSDLKIRVANNRVLLYSEKHGKQVIPRLTSAYNHSIDKLPLFRFLADLSYHYGRNGFVLDLRRFFPGLSYYPRVTYKKSILFLATWIISENQIQSLIQMEAAMLIATFKNLANNLHLPPVFSIAEGDQQLVFFRDRETDIAFFASCIKQKKEVILVEFLLENQESALVKNSTEEPFISQFNAFLIPQQPMSLVPVKIPLNSADKQKRKFIPGSEWLYLKIYTSKIGSKRLLLKIIPLIRRRYSAGHIRKWFFVRYEDHAPHIRLRMQIIPQDISEILVAFKNKLEDGINQHVIREYQIDVYSRELERYQTAGIAPTEDFFWASSELAVGFLKMKEKGNAFQIYELALLTVRNMIKTFLPEPESQLRFTEDSYQQFFPEFEEKMLRVGMDKKYRELATGISHLLNEPDIIMSTPLLKAYRQFSRAINDLFNEVEAEGNDREDFLRSIIHLHLNRLFTDDARKQEMIVYYLLFKFLLSEKGRRKNKKT